MAEELIRGVVGEAEVGGEELLIQNGCAKEIAHLLFFDGIAWQSQCVAAAGEDYAGDLAIERGKEGERTFVKREDGIASAELDAIGGGDVIDGRWIDAQRIQRIIEFVGCSLRRRGKRRREKTPQCDELRPNPHIRSVVTFGMEEQGGRGRRPTRN